MSTELIPFDFEGRQVRVVTDAQGEPWFVAADVCAALHLPDTHKAVARLDDDEKGRNSIPTLGGDQEMTVVNEPGLYSLVLGSRKPEAKRFKRWVTHEVLPTIRKTGRYVLSGTPALPAPTQDRVYSILLIGEAVAKVPGVKPGIAMVLRPSISLDTLLRDPNPKRRVRDEAQEGRVGEGARPLVGEVQA